MTQTAVTIQITPVSVPSTPSWMGEVVIYQLKKADFQVTCHAAKRLQRIGSLT